MLLQRIIKKYQEFYSFLDEIPTEELEKYSRSELKEFQKELQKLSYPRALPLEVDKIINEKKIKEFPELLGVHHYPIIKELTCLSDEDKINLDKHLYTIGFNRIIQKGSLTWEALTKYWTVEVQEKVLQFLVEQGILKRMYRLSICHDVITLSEKEVNDYLTYFYLKKNFKQLRKEELDTFYKLEDDLEVQYPCMFCDEEVEVQEDDIQEVLVNKYTHIYRIIKERDTSLDDV